jgi:hypothetical protein
LAAATHAVPAGQEGRAAARSQSKELFVSLMRAGETPTELVLYPGWVLPQTVAKETAASEAV